MALKRKTNHAVRRPTEAMPVGQARPTHVVRRIPGEHLTVKDLVASSTRSP
jgi:hypothetical protein